MKDKFEHKEGSFSAFENKKEKPEHADLRGDGKFNGQEVWINVWKKKDKNGKTYISGTIRPKTPKAESYEGGIRKPAVRTSRPDDMEDDSIPF